MYFEDAVNCMQACKGQSVCVQLGRPFKGLSFLKSTVNKSRNLGNSVHFAQMLNTRHRDIQRYPLQDSVPHTVPMITRLCPPPRRLLLVRPPSTTRHCPTHSKTLPPHTTSQRPNPLGDCLKKRYPAHYKTAPYPLQDSVPHGTRHCPTPIPDEVPPPICRLFKKRGPTHYKTMPYPLQDSVPSAAGKAPA